MGPLDDALLERAARHAALGEPPRLAIVEELSVSDRTPQELGERFGLPSNLLAHHLATLERAGLIRRVRSAGDRRRRYVQLNAGELDELAVSTSRLTGSVLFVCTHNSARSQLAAAMWRHYTGEPADSAGTEPTTAVHPGALAAARRHGLDLGSARPRALRPEDTADVVITVCDRAREQLGQRPVHHWSIGDPATTATDAAFDDAVRAIRARIKHTHGAPT